MTSVRDEIVQSDKRRYSVQQSCLKKHFQGPGCNICELKRWMRSHTLSFEIVISPSFRNDKYL